MPPNRGLAWLRDRIKAKTIGPMITRKIIITAGRIRIKRSSLVLISLDITVNPLIY